jgi:hypothetical protein
MKSEKRSLLKKLNYKTVFSYLNTHSIITMKYWSLTIVILYALLLSCEEQVVVESENENEVFSKKDYYEKQMKIKDFSLRINGACDDAIEDTLHERSVIYIDSESDAIIEFKFIGTCCQEFLGDYSIKNDTLIFALENVNHIECTCLCWYRYKLNLSNIQENYSSIKFDNPK